MNHEYHVVILGQSGEGKSVLSSMLTPPGAARPSTADAAPKSPTAAEQRDIALKTTYWATSDPVEFCDLRDALRHFGGVTEVTDEQVRAFFMALPSTTFGLGVTWGFEDTEVRDEIWRFAQEELALVKSIVALACVHRWTDWVKTTLGRERTCQACGLVEGEDWLEDVGYTRQPQQKQEDQS